MWKLAHAQHGVIARRQLIELGFSRRAIEHRLVRGRLHPVFQGVYAVGRPELSRRGRWMAAVLACGPDTVLSHGSAAALWGFGPELVGIIEVSRRGRSAHQRAGIRAHRHAELRAVDAAVRDGIPVTAVARTLVDLAGRLGADGIERAVNEADKLGLIDPEELRAAVDLFPGRRGVASLRQVLDRRTFRFTDSGLERAFLRLIDAAGLPRPETRRRLNGSRTDFHWPELGLVVETDGLRYHRTPAAQARDRRRDQAHTAAGLTPLRFTDEQLRDEPEAVTAVLRAVIARLRRKRGRGGPPST